MMSEREFSPCMPWFVSSLIPIAIGVALALTLQVVLPGAIGPYNSRIVMDVGIAIILAVSLNIVNGMTGQFSIGHAGFMALGGYAAGAITYYGSLQLWGDTPHPVGMFDAGRWMFALACVMGGIFAAAAGYAVGLPSLRLRGDYLAIVTLGFGEIVRVILQQTNPRIADADAMRNATLKDWFPPPVGGSLGFDGLPKYTNLFWIALFLSMTVIVAYRLKQSRYGRAMISIREDELAAQAMGVDIARTKVLAFVLSAFFAGIAGGLFAHEPGVILSPKDAGFQRSFDLVIMTVLGGRGSISGVMLAAAILTILPEVLRDFEQYRLIVFALLLIVMMIVRPQGLLGIKEIWQLWSPKRSKAGAA